jgi:hypothetical protein
MECGGLTTLSLSTACRKKRRQAAALKTAPVEEEILDTDRFISTLSPASAGLFL